MKASPHAVVLIAISRFTFLSIKSVGKKKNKQEIELPTLFVDVPQKAFKH
jgi:hypothetical protein